MKKEWWVVGLGGACGNPQKKNLILTLEKKKKLIGMLQFQSWMALCRGLWRLILADGSCFGVGFASIGCWLGLNR